MKSFLFSTLAARYRVSSLDALAKDHACDWLLWEPGAWKPPGLSTVIARAANALDVPPAPAKIGAEALAMALPHAAARATLGRGEGCDLIINDGTLSNLHLTFTRGERGWVVEDAGSRNGSWVNGRVLEPGRTVMLVDGISIVPAQVALSFHTPEGLWARLQGAGQPQQRTR